MNTLKRTITLLGILLFSFVVFSQTVEDAGAKYNEGNTAMQNKQYADAVTLYNDALAMADAAGPDADQLKGNIQTQLINAYLKNGLVFYKNKNYDAAITNLNQSYKLAKSTGDDTMANKLAGYIAKLHSSKGLSLIKQKKLDDALVEFKNARVTNPKCVISFYGEGIVYKDKGDMTEMMSSFDKAIQYGTENQKMVKYANKAKSVAVIGLLAEATKELQKEHAAKAVEYINNSFKYKAADGETYYYLSVAYNKLKKYGEAIAAAKKSIGMKEGDKSDVYFQLGQAYEGKGDNTSACSAFKKVTTGPNVDAAKYEIKEKLKCS